MGRRRSTSFYGEGAHEKAYGQCSAIDGAPARDQLPTAAASSGGEDANQQKSNEQDTKKKLVPAEIDIPQPDEHSDEDGSSPEEQEAGTQTPKPVRRQNTQILNSGRRSYSLSVWQKVKLLLRRRKIGNTEGMDPIAEELMFEDDPPKHWAVERPDDAMIQRFVEILRTYNYTEGPQESIELLAQDCEWDNLTQSAAKIYTYFRSQEDQGSKLSHREFELKALVDDFLIRVFDRDETPSL